MVMVMVTASTSVLESTHGHLSDVEAQVLAFERDWWRLGGAKDDTIRERFGMSATRYYQLLNTLIDKPSALESDPVLVRRLRRMRQSRQEARSARRLR